MTDQLTGLKEQRKRKEAVVLELEKLFHSESAILEKMSKQLTELKAKVKHQKEEVSNTETALLVAHDAVQTLTKKIAEIEEK